MIGTLAALALGAATVGSAALSSSASSKVSNAATQAADTSAAVQREQLGAAQNALAPYNQAGLPATGAINSLLGLGSGQTQQVQTPSYGFPTYDPNTGQVTFSGDTSQMTGTVGTTPQQDYQSAFDNYKNSTGYQFRTDQGIKALNSGYAGAGTLQSGAAMKGIMNYGQNQASQEFNNYLNALGNQQSLGLSAGSALAGVGQNYANSIGNINSNKADAIGNAALANAQNTNSLLNGLTAGIFKYGVK